MHLGELPSAKPEFRPHPMDRSGPFSTKVHYLVRESSCSSQIFQLFESVTETRDVIPFLFRIAYLGLRDVDPPEQAVLESLGIASYYVQVIRPILLKNDNIIDTFFFGSSGHG